MLSLIVPMLVRRQSYGIKVGYGAGGAGQTVRPGEPPAPKTSSCC